MNTPSRRQFLRDCSLVATAASLLPSSLLAQPRRAAHAVARPMSLEWFATELNTTFSLRNPTGFLGLRLVEASVLPATAPDAPDARNERFSLVFCGPSQQPLPQDTYLFEHPRLGTQPIFIVPRPRLSGGGDCYYEAVFNCALSPADLAEQLSAAPSPVLKS